MTIDPVEEGAKIEKLVRSVYERALGNRDLDEADREFLDIAVNQQVILFIADSVWKNTGPLSEEGQSLVKECEQVLSFALFKLNLENPYRLSKPN